MKFETLILSIDFQILFHTTVHLIRADPAVFRQAQKSICDHVRRWTSVRHGIQSIRDIGDTLVADTLSASQLYLPVCGEKIRYRQPTMVTQISILERRLAHRAWIPHVYKRSLSSSAFPVRTSCGTADVGFTVSSTVSSGCFLESFSSTALLGSF